MMSRSYMHFLTGALLMLSACTSSSMDTYQGTEPKLELEEYFTGPIKAWGIVQDWRGRVVSRFDVTMHGSWEDGVGTLKEDFKYYNGDTQQRTWTITKIDDDTYEGRADDILDKATGRTVGNAMNWAYKMDLEVDGSTYRIRFDDWMWLMHDGVLINRSYLKKFGFTVAELTLFMQKQEE